jgi:hypothetical protein
MTGTANDAFLSFLVEDVILTLGTLRGALGWLDGGEDCPPAARAEGFARIARQIAALEDRARDLWARLHVEPCNAPVDEEPDIANLFQLTADEDVASGLTFRTRRARA